jgi:hypothetical protein
MSERNESLVEYICRLGARRRGDLARVREYQDLAPAQRGEAGGFGGIWGLDLYLLRYKCLKWLIAFGLMILHRRSGRSESYLTAASARE